jgi:hypothetical protein
MKKKMYKNEFKSFLASILNTLNDTHRSQQILLDYVPIKKKPENK